MTDRAREGYRPHDYRDMASDLNAKALGLVRHILDKHTSIILATVHEEIAALTERLAEEKKLSEAISRDCNECANQRNEALARLSEVDGDARRFRDLCELVQDGTLCLGSYEASDDAEYFDGLADIPPLMDRLERMAGIIRKVRTKADAAITASQEEG